MQPTSTRSKWLRILRTLALGSALGVLQWLLLSGQVMFASWGPYLALGGLFYVLLPAFAGFLASWKKQDPYEEISAGCRVAGISLLIIVSAAVVDSVLVVLLTTPQPTYPPCGESCFTFPDFSVGVALGKVITITLIGVLGVAVGGMVGGWIGGFLGRATNSNR